jgi:2'-5' RNA ligase
MPDAAKDLRLFVAVNLGPQTRRAVIDAMESLKREARSDKLRWVHPDAIHLTLAFLGATPEERVPEIGAALAASVRNIAPFTLAPLGIGSFGGRRNLRVIWIAVGGDEGTLADLAEHVENALAPLGFPGEQRAFNAHLTLARVRDDATPQDRARLSDLIVRFDPPAMPASRIDHISLMQSTLGPGGATYRELAKFRLDGTPANEP